MQNCFQSQTLGNTWRFHSSSRRDGVPVLRGARGDGIIDTAFIHSENDDKIPGRRFLQLRFQLTPKKQELFIQVAKGAEVCHLKKSSGWCVKWLM